MTLMQMKYAIAVADTKSMNEAARSLFITQPSLSASVKELENEIGIELFKRTNRGITVTPEGEEFLKELESAWDGLSDTVNHLRQNI